MRFSSNQAIQVTALSFLLGLSACVEVEAEVPDVEVRQEGIGFPGIPGASTLGEVSTTNTFSFSSDALSFIEDLNSEVYALEVTIQPTGTTKGLGFIRAARVLLSNPGSGAAEPATEIINYERVGDADSVGALTVKTLHPVDVTKLWSTSGTKVTLTIAGTLPETAWTADFSLRLGGKIAYKL